MNGSSAMMAVLYGGDDGREKKIAAFSAEVPRRSSDDGFRTANTHIPKFLCVVMISNVGWINLLVIMCSTINGRDNNYTKACFVLMPAGMKIRPTA